MTHSGWYAIKISLHLSSAETQSVYSTAPADWARDKEAS